MLAGMATYAVLILMGRDKPIETFSVTGEMADPLVNGSSPSYWLRFLNEGVEVARFPACQVLAVTREPAEA